MLGDSILVVAGIVSAASVFAARACLPRTGHRGACCYLNENKTAKFIQEKQLKAQEGGLSRVTRWPLLKLQPHPTRQVLRCTRRT